MKIGKHNLLKDGVYIIAELSANHNQSFEVAVRSVEAIARTGANAVKLQTYRPDTITLNHNAPEFKTNSNGPWAGRTLYDLYKESYTPWEWHEPLRDIAINLGLDFFSSPFDFSAVDFLEELDVPAYKIASFEINDIPLISYVASKGKPVIISTGIASKSDIELAIDTCLKAGNKNIILLKCTSNYPTPIQEANLLMIREYSEKFNVITGISDHTIGFIAPVVGTALGAKIIEKHFILDRSLGGPDSFFSMDEMEFTDMVKAVRVAEMALGKVDYNLTKKQIEERNYSRSLYVIKDIEEGETFTKENIKSIRPGKGLPPFFYHQILGMKAAQRLCYGTPLESKHINNFHVPESNIL
jgi:pseudaminic acid synthase